MLCNCASNRYYVVQNKKEKPLTYRFCRIIFKRAFDFFLRNEFLFAFSSLKKPYEEHLKVLHDFTDKVIQDRRQELLSGKIPKIDEAIDDVGIKRKMAFLDILLQSSVDGKPLSNLDIREEVDTFMFEVIIFGMDYF